MPKKQAIQAASQEVDSGTGDDQYSQDEFMDGEETTSKEIKRSAFQIDSITEQRFTPGTVNEQPTSSNNNRFPQQPSASLSMDETYSPLDSGGQNVRPSAIETILNDKKPTKFSPPNDEDSDDYDDDDW